MVDMNSQAALVFVILLITSLTPISLGAEEPNSNITCEIIVDWDVIYDWEDMNYSSEILHRYVVNFDPPYSNGTSPGGVNVQIEHISNGLNILESNDISSVIAGGHVDIILNSVLRFGDSIEIELETSDSFCSRSIGITQWNQPIADHEITRETSWQIDEGENEDNQQLSFNGRGWQKRTGSLMESNELGNGSIILDISDGSNIGKLDLDLNKVWLNETYDGLELLKQEFEMIGSGSIILTTQGEDELSIEAQINDAYILRSLTGNKLTERISIEGSGWLSFNGGSNDSQQGGFGEISVFYYETLDENGVRRLQDTQLEANLTLRVNAGDVFSFDLDDFFFREKWENGLRADQYLKLKGSGNFDFIASESPYIEVNGTIPMIHMESQGGETIVDTIIVDGTYDGDAEGSFGLVRKIIDSGAYQNESGEYFEADKIQNEIWFNVSATPFGPINQELNTEHNLTYEYTVPQEDWENRILKYEYVEDNGSINNEYPPNSPTIIQPTPPSSESIFSTPISRETGLCPVNVFIGDKYTLIGNSNLMLEVSITDFKQVIIDSHLVTTANWEGDYGTGILANGSMINEGLLSGLLNDVYRNVDLGLSNDSNKNGTFFIEHQSIDEIIYPSIITSDENTIPSINTSLDSSVRFREGILYTEGGNAHLEITVLDVDTDMISVNADLSPLGLGIVALSDSGLDGDLVIRDGIWTTLVNHNGLEFGDMDVDINMNDIWGSTNQTVSIQVTNSAPKMNSIYFSPLNVFRGDIIEVNIEAYDGHGIESVIIDMFSQGGALTPLQFNDGLWIGEFTISEYFTPGDLTLDIRLTDMAGESRLTSQIYSNGVFKNGDILTINNEPPKTENITLMNNNKIVNSISIPNSGNLIPHSIEVSLIDIDGISSAQIKIGRLAPIGSSDVWLLLLDDGRNSDRIANDGIYTISFDVRSTLLEGDFTILIRATDNYLSMTPSELQPHIISLEKTSSNENNGNNWLSNNAMPLTLITMTAMLISGIGAAIYLIRKSDI